jgi:hypothetical protein
MTINPTGGLITHRPHPIGSGDQYTIRYPNGYGASVVRHWGSYGGDSGLWELAVLRFAGEGPYDCTLTYDTPITDDVIGWLNEADVHDLCDQIRDLPERKP